MIESVSPFKLNTDPFLNSFPQTEHVVRNVCNLEINVRSLLSTVFPLSD